MLTLLSDGSCCLAVAVFLVSYSSCQASRRNTLKRLWDKSGHAFLLWTPFPLSCKRKYIPISLLIPKYVLFLIQNFFCCFLLSQRSFLPPYGMVPECPGHVHVAQDQQPHLFSLSPSLFCHWFSCQQVRFMTMRATDYQTYSQRGWCHNSNGYK